MDLQGCTVTNLPSTGPTSPPRVGTTSPWYDEGVRAGGALDRVASVLVTGRDGEAAAWVALGLARAQADGRRVAVADLVGDAAALATAGDDDGLGVSDSFTYGVSLNKIARAVDEGGQLFVLPSGSEPVATEAIVGSDRWARLAAGFREAGALLVVAARADTPGLGALAAAVDGMVVAGDLAGALPDAAPPLAVVAPPAALRRARLGRPRLAPAGDAGAGVPASDADGRVPGAATSESPTLGVAYRGPTPPVGTQSVLLEPPASAARRGPFGTRRARLIGLGLAALTGVAGAAFWLLPHGLGRDVPPAGPPRATRGAAQSGMPNAAVVAPAARVAAGGRDTTPAAAAPVVDPGPIRLVPSNPGDSASAVLYAVHVVSSNTPDGASIDWRVDRTPPVLALTPVLQDGAPTYRLIVGAYRTRAQADSLLRDLQRRGVVGDSSGSVVRAPYALLVEARVPAAEAARRVQALAAKGVPTYPLSRGDGTVALYAGAFQTAQEAAYLARAARAAGVAATLVYRTGAAL